MDIHPSLPIILLISANIQQNVLLCYNVGIVNFEFTAYTNKS